MPHPPFSAPPPLRESTAASGYANATVTKPPEWHGIIAWDALLNGMATGLFMVAALVELAAPSTFTAVAIAAYPIALVLLLVDLLCLVLDLGDPLRFHHMLRVFKPRSPMSVGVWCLTIFSLPLTAAAALSLLSQLGMGFVWARRLAVILGLPLGFASAAYKGVLLSTNAQPGWKDARWMGGYLTNSALVLGCAELLAVSVVMGEARAAAMLRFAFIALLAVNVIPLALLYANLRPTLAIYFTRRQHRRVGGLILAAGTLVPLGLLLAGRDAWLTLAAVISFWLGSLAIRFVYVKIPHMACAKCPTLTR